jgi:Tfp pilus assembly protein PilZ
VVRKDAFMERNTVNERRYFHRVRHAQPVQFRFMDPSMYGGCLSCDLSEGGIRVRFNDFIPLGTELALQIKLADDNFVDCSGRVVWVQKNRFGDSYQAGLEFAGRETIPNTRKKIHGFLFHHLHPSSSLR